MLPILPILPKKVVLSAKMLSNSIENASDPADLPFSAPRTIREPQTRPNRRAHRVGAGSSGSVGARIFVASCSFMNCTRTMNHSVHGNYASPKILREPRRGDIANVFAKRIVRRKPPALGTEFRPDTNSPVGIRQGPDDVAPTALGKAIAVAWLQICRAYGARRPLISSVCRSGPGGVEGRRPGAASGHGPGQARLRRFMAGAPNRNRFLEALAEVGRVVPPKPALTPLFLPQGTFIRTR
jgi:hypothetical protein